ncbi:MAG: DUF3990 domain-containing protein [Clostridia bacterium]|nr:DUF3990 domain-containing protein [Clostridia bacterium]
MIEVNSKYKIKEDIEFIKESERINNLELSKLSNISRVTIDEIKKTGKTTDAVLEKFYSFIYKSNYRINSVKEELMKERHHLVLFHGSKYGLEKVSIDQSRDNCDFGKGFYLGESYAQALAFVAENEKSSVYSFAYNLEGLNVLEFDCSVDWMLAICHYRGTLGKYSNSKAIQELIAKVEAADIVVAPIADNRMFYIMAQFTEEEINADVALHSLSTSKLGKQYIIKSEKALERLNPIEKYYICSQEREECKKHLIERSYEIDTKLKLAKREFRNGLYIEEILK